MSAEIKALMRIYRIDAQRAAEVVRQSHELARLVAAWRISQAQTEARMYGVA